MRRLAMLLTCLMMLVGLSHGQYTFLTGSNFGNGFGDKLASGKLCLTPVGNDHATAMPFKIGGVGQATKEQKCFTVTAGVLQSGAKTADTTLTDPVNVCFKVSLTNTATGQTIIGGKIPTGYDCVQPHGTTWSFDSDFTPNLPALTVQQPGPIGPIGATGPAGPAGTLTDNTGFTAGGDSSVAGKLSVNDLVTKGPLADVRAYGGCNGNAVHDTVSVNMALAALSARLLDNTANVYAGELALPQYCNIDGDNIVWGAAASYFWITLTIDSYLNISSGTLAMPKMSHIRGVARRGGGRASQFQDEPAAWITCGGGHSVTVPCITMNSNSSLHDLSIDAGRDAPNIQLKHHANMRLVNVASNSGSPNVNAYPIEIDDSEWVWIEKSTFLGGNGVGGSWSMHITNTLDAEGGTGLIHFSGGVLAGKGILWEGGLGTSGGAQGDSFFRDLIFESLDTPVFVFKNGTFGNIRLTNVSVADFGGYSDGVWTGGNGAIELQSATVRELTLDDSFFPSTVPIISDGAPCISGLHIIGGRKYIYSGARLVGNTQCAWDYLHDNVYEGNVLATGQTSGVFQAPLTTLALNQNVTAYTGATTAMAPDGSSTAASFAATVNIDSSSAIAVGDWFCIGGWFRNVSFQDLNGTGFQFWNLAHPGAVRFLRSGTDGMGFAGGDMGGAHDGWRPLGYCDKVTAMNDATVTVRLALNADTGHQFAVWKPWVARIPAGTIPDEEVMRLEKYVLRNGISGMTGGGVVAIYPHQKIWLGNSDAELKRGPNGGVCTNGGCDLGQGSSLPGVCSAGDQFFKTTAPIGWQQCTATNTWAGMGNSSSSAAGSQYQYQYNGGSGAFAAGNLWTDSTGNFHQFRNGGASQTIQIFHTFTDASNYSGLQFDGTGNIKSIKAGTGGGENINLNTHFDILFQYVGTEKARFDFNSLGALRPAVNAGLSLGSSSYHWNNGFIDNLYAKLLQMSTATAPTCDSTTRGQFNYTAGGTGVKDVVQVCGKDAGDAYAWRTIY